MPGIWSREHSQNRSAGVPDLKDQDFITSVKHTGTSFQSTCEIWGPKRLKKHSYIFTHVVQAHASSTAGEARLVPWPHGNSRTCSLIPRDYWTKTIELSSPVLHHRELEWTGNGPSLSTDQHFQEEICKCLRDQKVKNSSLLQLLPSGQNDKEGREEEQGPGKPPHPQNTPSLHIADPDPVWQCFTPAHYSEAGLS